MVHIDKSNRWDAIAVSVVVAIVLVLVTHIPVVQAETPYDLTNCYSGTATGLYRTKELTILTIDSKGIALSNNESKIFDNSNASKVETRSPPNMAYSGAARCGPI
jgi:hypothetical protein